LVRSDSGGEILWRAHPLRRLRRAAYPDEPGVRETFDLLRIGPDGKLSESPQPGIAGSIARANRERRKA
jgi:hypothetical protein